jgi:hypothetical protein
LHAAAHLSNVGKTRVSPEETYDLHNPRSSGDQQVALFPEAFNASREAAANAGAETHVDDSILLDLWSDEDESPTNETTSLETTSMSSTEISSIQTYP